MPRYIDAEQMERHIMESKVFTQYFKALVQGLIWGENTADVVPVVRGEWIAEQKTAEYCEFRCSICDYSIGETDQFDETEVKQFSEWYKHCPCCGAMMEVTK